MVVLYIVIGAIVVLHVYNIAVDVKEEKLRKAEEKRKRERKREFSNAETHKETFSK